MMQKSEIENIFKVDYWKIQDTIYDSFNWIQKNKYVLK